MQHYKTPDGTIRAIEPGQEFLIEATWQEITNEELEALTRPQIDPLQIVKDEAKRRLTDTDWAMLPDVLIGNRAAFETYRAAVRAIYLAPVENAVFPERPEAVWL